MPTGVLQRIVQLAVGRILVCLGFHYRHCNDDDDKNYGTEDGTDPCLPAPIPRVPSTTFGGLAIGVRRRLGIIDEVDVVTKASLGMGGGPFESSERHKARRMSCGRGMVERFKCM